MSNNEPVSVSAVTVIFAVGAKPFSTSEPTSELIWLFTFGASPVNVSAPVSVNTGTAGERPVNNRLPTSVFISGLLSVRSHLIPVRQCQLKY